MNMRRQSTLQKALSVWGAILLIWSFYRLNLQLPLWFDELIAKPLVFILPIYLFTTKYEHLNFFQAVAFDVKKIKKEFFIGLGIGLLFIITILFTNVIKKGLLFPMLPISLFLTEAFFALTTGISEEVLSRGFILKRLYEDSKNIFTASFFSSFLFFFLHVPMLFTNPKLTGPLILLFMTTDFLLSMICSVLFLSRKQVVAPIVVHACYNFALFLLIA